MRNFLLCFVGAAAVACVLPTEGRNPKCWYPGDTIDVVGPYRDAHGGWACTWIITQHEMCTLPQEGNARRFTASDCVLPDSAH